MAERKWRRRWRVLLVRLRDALIWLGRALVLQLHRFCKFLRDKLFGHKEGEHPGVVPPYPNPPIPKPSKPRFIDRERYFYDFPDEEDPAWQGLLFRSYNRPIPDSAKAFAETISIASEVHDAIAQAGITAAWPVELYSDGASVVGYAMESLPEVFLSAQGGTLLDFAQRPDLRQQHQDAFSQDAFSQVDKLEIIRLVGVFLDTLHHHDCVYGNLSWHHIYYALPSHAQTQVRLAILDTASVHYIRSLLVKRKDLTKTHGWQDPLAPVIDGYTIPVGMDLDRYQFALLFYRLMANVKGPQTAVFPTDPKDIAAIRIAPTPGLSQERLINLEKLLRRAATGGHGSRPPLCEWLHYLDVPSHRILPIERIGR